MTQTDEIRQVLSQAPEEVSIEEMVDETGSPLNQPVIEKDIGGISGAREATEEEHKDLQAPYEYEPQDVSEDMSDAPEQEISEGSPDENMGNSPGYRTTGGPCPTGSRHHAWHG